MSNAIVVTTPSLLEAKSIARWIAREGVSVRVDKAGREWGIYTAPASLGRARAAFKKVIAANNPPGVYIVVAQETRTSPPIQVHGTFHSIADATTLANDLVDNRGAFRAAVLDSRTRTTRFLAYGHRATRTVGRKTVVGNPTIRKLRSTEAMRKAMRKLRYEGGIWTGYAHRSRGKPWHVGVPERHVATAKRLLRGMKNPAIQVWDRVKYSREFLRSTGTYTGPLPFARGTVTKLEPLGCDSILATIDWGNPSIPKKVNVKNLTKAGDPERMNPRSRRNPIVSRVKEQWMGSSHKLLIRPDIEHENELNVIYKTKHGSFGSGGVRSVEVRGVIGPGENPRSRKNAVALPSGVAPDGTKYVMGRKSSTGEWVLRAYVGGKYHEGRTYYTTDKDDAIGTFNFLMKRGATKSCTNPACKNPRHRHNPVIIGKTGRWRPLEVIQRSANLRGIREYVGKNLVKVISIKKLPSGSTAGDALLQIDFANGSHYSTGFADWTVLKNFLRNWRNVYGAPLIVNGERAGVVSYSNAALSPSSSGTNPRHGHSAGKNSMVAWDVYLSGKNIDTVYYSADMTKMDVLTSLIRHDGYDPRIRIVKRKGTAGKNPLTRKEAGRLMKRAYRALTFGRRHTRAGRESEAEYHYGRASGLSDAVEDYAPRDARSGAEKLHMKAVHHGVSRVPHWNNPLRMLLGKKGAKSAKRYS